MRMVHGGQHLQWRGSWRRCSVEFVVLQGGLLIFPVEAGPRLQLWLLVFLVFI